MAAHRYWRATAFEAYGAGDLELSEFHLLAGGVRVDAPATLTASVAPDVTGVLANLQDDVVSTSARWSASLVKKLTLQWDFGGAPVDVSNPQLSGESEWRFPLIIKTQWSDDGTTWEGAAVSSGIAWPGKNIKTSYAASVADLYLSNVVLQMDMEGLDGGAVFIDGAGHSVTVHSATTSTVAPKYGLSSALFTGSGSNLRVADSPDFAFGSGGFCVEFWARPSYIGLQGFVAKRLANSTIAPFLVYMDSTGKVSALASMNGMTFGVAITAATALVAYDWVHVAFERDKDLFSLYIMGASTGSPVTLAGSLVVNHDPVLIGAADTTTIPFSGEMDELRISNRARYRGNFTPAMNPPYGLVGGIVSTNKVKGRSPAQGIDVAYASSPPLVYGVPQIALPEYLGIESGSVKDQITGVLGEGIGRVRGTVAIAIKNSPDQPVRRKVRLIRERDGLVIREAWSDAVTGEYDFQYVDEAQTYTVVSYDYTLAKRAVIADNQIPELMP